MAESVVQPGTNSTEAPDTITTEQEPSVEETQDIVGELDVRVGTCAPPHPVDAKELKRAPQAPLRVPTDLPSPTVPIPQTTSTPTIIWTPSFIVTFAVVLVLGLSADGVFTQGWVSHLYSRDWDLLAHAVVVLGGWIVIVARARSWWIRVGGLFACIWVLFAGFSFVLDLRSIDPSSPVVAHLHAAIALALLGSYICLSLDRTPFQHWDARSFRLALIVGSCVVACAYFLTPVDNRSVGSLEGDIAITALSLCVCVWWIRPSCWKARPGPTFLFGMAPTMLLFLAIPGVASAATNLLLSQVVFLCVLLGMMRLLQCEIVN